MLPGKGLLLLRIIPICKEDMWGNEDSTALAFPPVSFHDIQNGTNTTDYNHGSRLPPHQRQFRGTKRKTDNHGPNSYNSKNLRQFYCDTCDRSFECQDSLEEHFTQHKICGWNGCKFQAHYKIVELHVKMQHETGFADKIMVLNNPEEIEKWKNERRKNYPSAENVARRQAEQAKMMERGELIQNKSFGKFMKTNRGSHTPLKSPMGRGRGWGRPFRRNVPSDGSSMRSERCGKRWSDHDNGINYFDLDIQKSHRRFENVSSQEISVSISAKRDELKDEPVADAITDSEDDLNEAPLEVPISYVPKVLNNLLEYQSEPEQDSSSKPTAKDVPKQSFRGPPPNHRPTRKATLLEMLLAKEIRQERNMIFQCVRYIVQNDFFGKSER